MERKMMDEKHQLKRKKSFELSQENREQIKRGMQPVKEKERPSTAWDFDVFISFRGKDTRNGFTSHLYKELAETRGIKTFIDDKDLGKGKKISDLITHIEGSKIFLPVFSKNYADSKWCLREIAKMVEINKREGGERPIIPVFYHVDPSDVKHPTDPKSSFRNAFEKHQGDEKLSKEQINEWSTALTEGGNFSGFCLSDAEGNEAKLITLIGKDVSKRLRKVVPFDMQPIGIGPYIVTLKQMLEKKEEGVCMIGICGLGGIGKTTLARALYNELSFEFESSCFLSDIRDHEKKEGLQSLQATLMKQVLGKNISVSDVEQRASFIRQKSGRKKILLILDDVDHPRQLEAFTAELGKCFGAGSKIIVTTRDKKVLTSHGLQEKDIYCPEGLDVDHSLKLFCHHAFHSDQPSAAFGELSQQVVKVAQGLPLALKVFGSLFWDLKEKEEWEEMLEKLKCDQDKEIHERLKVSYDCLNHSEKSVFLDIACFFIGKRKEYPVYMWWACDYRPRITLKALQNKSLIKIDEDGCFEMHDQIRDMGRMIVKEEGNSDPLKYSRPWSEDQMSEVLSGAQVSPGNPYIQGIFFIYCFIEKIKMSWRVIEAMPKLRMMISSIYRHQYIEEEEETIRLPSNVRWLEWTHGPYQRLTFHNNRHEQLCVLNLSYGRFRDLRPHRMVFPKLKVLNLSWCRYLIRTPDFTHLCSLEKLLLGFCSSLTQMDESIEHLDKLVELNLCGCRKLRLPAGLCKLSSLESLNLSRCVEISVLPTQLGNLRSLKYLYLHRTSISDVTDSIGSLQCLTTLDLAYCKGISILPKQIGDLTSLKYLNLRRTSVSDVPESIGSLQSLELLCLDGCKGISILPKQLGDLTSLERLTLRGTSISVLPDSIGSLQSIKRLDLGKCTFLQKIPDSIGDLKSLRWISLKKCKLLEQLPNSMGMLTSLEKLKIDHCKSLREVPDSLGDLNNDFRISVEGCILLEKLPNSITTNNPLFRIEGFKSLRRLPDSLGDGVMVHSLSIRDCESLKEIPDSIGMRMVFLRELDLSGCTLLGRIPKSIGDLKSLNCLRLSGCRSLEELPECIGRLLSLQELDLSGCTLLGRIPKSIGDLKSLNCLRLSGCRSLEELPECIGRLLSLEELDLSGCTLLTKIPETIRYLSGLTHLRLQDCRSLNELPECIGMFLSLKVLDFSGCTSIKSVPESIGDLQNLDDLSIEYGLWDSIGKLTSSRQLHLSGCSPLALKKLHESMEGLISLRMLSICGGISVNKLPDFMLWRLMFSAKLVLSELEEIPELIGEFPSWEAIVIEDCPKLESLPQLSCPLTYLGILRCAAFRKLSDPSTLDCLQTLVLQGCKAFTDLSGLESLISLRKLALIDRDGLSRDLMDKLSQVSFKELRKLFICGASNGSDLLFGLPKSNVGQAQRLKGMCCLTEKLPSDTSDINIHIKVLEEGKIAIAVAYIQTREEEQDYDTEDEDEDENDEDEDEDEDEDYEFGKWVLGDQDIYEIDSEEGKEIVKWVGEGNTTLMIPTTYNYYRLRMASLLVTYMDHSQELPMLSALSCYF